jgi:hypothetical protein
MGIVRELLGVTASARDVTRPHWSRYPLGTAVTEQTRQTRVLPFVVSKLHELAFGCQRADAGARPEIVNRYQRRTDSEYGGHDEESTSSPFT